MTLLNVTYPAWMDRAACSDSDADFFPAPGYNARAAKAVCHGCPVRLACLTWALDQGVDHGVYGGLTPPERHRLGPRAYPCPDCGKPLRSTAAVGLHRRHCQAVAS